MGASFPEHQAAKNDKGNSFIPNKSKVILAPLFSSQNSATLSPIEKEAEFIADSLYKILYRENKKHQIYDKKNKKFREIKASDCCILYRNATHVEIFERYLLNKGIPYFREEQKGFFARPEIRDLLSYLQFMMSPCDVLSLYNFFKESSSFHLSDELIYEVCQNYKEEEVIISLLSY